MLKKALRTLIKALLAAILVSGVLGASPHGGIGLGSVPAVGACPIVDPDCPH